MQEAVAKSGDAKPKKSKDKKQKKPAKSDKPVHVDRPVPALSTSGPEVVTRVPARKKTIPPASSASIPLEDLQAGPIDSTFASHPLAKHSIFHRNRMK